MSQPIIVNKEYSTFKTKNNNNSNSFRYYSSLIKKNNENNKYIINNSSDIDNNPNKIGYIETESNFSKINACTCINCTNTLNSNINNYYKNLDNSKHGKYSLGYKIFHMDKNSKNRFFSAKISNKKNNKYNEIYLNNYINSSSDEKISKRIQSSNGFLRKIDFELNQLLSNRTKKEVSTMRKSYNNQKNVNLNFHNNNYIYDYISNDINNKKNIKKQLFFQHNNNKNKDIDDINKKESINLFNSNNNSEKNNNYFKVIINNIIRKVEFLNEKNDNLSDENTMNLLNNEEYYLYKKLNNFFKENYSIKKFSKSIIDEKTGNKYLLPLFNNKIISKYNNHKKEKHKNKNKIEKNRLYNDYHNNNLINEINNIENKNKPNKKIVTVYAKNKSYEQKSKKLNVLIYPSNIDILPEKINKKKKINLSYYKNKIKIFFNKKKKERDIILNKDKKLNIVTNHTKDNSMNMNNNAETTNTLDNFIFESTKKITIDNFTPIKNKIISKNVNESKNNKTVNISKTKHIKKFFDKKYNNIFDKKKYIINKEKDLYKEHNISKIKRDKKSSIDKNLKGNKNQQVKGKTLDNLEKEEKEEKTNENFNVNNKDKRKSTLRLNYEKKIRETKRLLKINANLNLKNFQLDDNKKNNLIENEKQNRNLIKKKLMLEDNENNDLSSSFDIEKEEERLKELKKITISNNLILKKNIEIEEKKLLVRIEKKKDKTIKLLYQYINRNIKEAIKKEHIKILLTQSEFREAVDLLKTQINKTRELSSEEPNKVKKPVTDEEIIDILYIGMTKDVENMQNSQNNTSMRKSTYIPYVHLKGKSKEKKEKEEEKESEEVIKIKLEREKEKEKLKIMVNEMTLSNELRFHIQETNNKELRERFQTLLSQIESYQNLNMAEYVEAIKNNYLLLKEEMNKIISDKEMEDRINGFVSNLDIERNVLESRWNYLSNKLNIIDNRFHSFLEKLKQNSIKYKGK